MVSSKKGPIIALALLFCALAGALRAQVLYGSLVGNVTDPSSAAIPNASISATNNQIGRAHV